MRIKTPISDFDYLVIQINGKKWFNEKFPLNSDVYEYCIEYADVKKKTYYLGLSHKDSYYIQTTRMENENINECLCLPQNNIKQEVINEIRKMPIPNQVYYTIIGYCILNEFNLKYHTTENNILVRGEIPKDFCETYRLIKGEALAFNTYVYTCKDPKNACILLKMNEKWDYIR